MENVSFFKNYVFYFEINLFKNLDGYYKGCSLCVGVKLVNKLLGFKKGDCICYECDDDKCNSAGGVLSNLKIILFCLTIMIINGK